MASGGKSVRNQVSEIQELIEDASETLRQAQWAMETLLARLDGPLEANTSAGPASTTAQTRA